MQNNTNPENLLIEMYNQLIQFLIENMRLKQDDIPSKIIYNLINMPKNEVTLAFSKNSMMIKSELAEKMLESGLIQKASIQDYPQYYLTFQGLAKAILIKYGISYEEQFTTLLKHTSERFEMDEQKPLDYREKIAGLCFILMMCTSKETTIDLQSEENKNILENVLDDVTLVLKKYKQINEDEDWRHKVKRGEHVTSALKSRLNNFPRKSGHLYHIESNTTGYFALEKSGEIDLKAFSTLLKKLFNFYEIGCDYEALYEELANISRKYYLCFIGRNMNPLTSIQILRQLRSFFERDIIKMPHKICCNNVKECN